MVYNTQDCWSFLDFSISKEWSLYREAFGDDALRFASHEESYMVEGFG
jgi:hypothetical protein